MASPPLLSYFVPDLPTELHVDASRLRGLGYALLQQHGDVWKLVCCGSRFITPTESRYSSTELEFLGALWAATKCRIYILGRKDITLVTDHEPLVNIINSKFFDQFTNSRLLRMKEKILPFDLRAQRKKGSKHLSLIHI